MPVFGYSLQSPKYDSNRSLIVVLLLFLPFLLILENCRLVPLCDGASVRAVKYPSPPGSIAIIAEPLHLLYEMTPPIYYRYVKEFRDRLRDPVL